MITVQKKTLQGNEYEYQHKGEYNIENRETENHINTEVL